MKPAKEKPVLLHHKLFMVPLIQFPCIIWRKFIAKRIGLSLGQIHALAKRGIRHGYTFFSEEAKRLGFIDGIVKNPYPLFSAKQEV